MRKNLREGRKVYLGRILRPFFDVIVCSPALPHSFMKRSGIGARTDINNNLEKVGKILFWIVKNSKGEVLYISESYIDAYNYLFLFEESIRKDMGIFLDYIVEDWR